MTPEAALPAGWRRTSLGALADDGGGFQTGPFGSQLRASDYVPPPTGWPAVRRIDGRRTGGRSPVPVVMPRDLAGGSISTASLVWAPAEKALRLEKHRLRSGDLLLARRGEIGRCALITSGEHGWLCGTGCLRVRLSGPGVFPRYLLHFLRSPATVAWLEDHAIGQTMLHLNAKIVSRLPVRLPPSAEQRQIARVLESADETVRSTRALAEQVRRVHDGLMHDRLLGTAGELPQGWKIRPLGELCAFANGNRFRVTDWSSEGLPIIRIQNLNGSTEFKRFAGFTKPAWIVEPGELVFAWAGKKGTSFGPRIWPGPRGVLNQHIFRIRPREGVAKLWLYEALRRATREIEDKAHGFTASLVHVRKADVVSHPIAVPPYREQCRIAEHSAELADRESLERKALERAMAIKRGLVDDLLSGRVRAG